MSWNVPTALLFPPASARKEVEDTYFLPIQSSFLVPRSAARLGKSKSAIGYGALRMNRSLRCTAAPRWSQPSKWVRAEPSGVNVMGRHGRAPSILWGYSGECQYCRISSSAPEGRTCQIQSYVYVPLSGSIQTSEKRTV